MADRVKIYLLVASAVICVGLPLSACKSAQQQPDDLRIEKVRPRPNPVLVEKQLTESLRQLPPPMRDSLRPYLRDASIPPSESITFSAIQLNEPWNIDGTPGKTQEELIARARRSDLTSDSCVWLTYELPDKEVSELLGYRKASGEWESLATRTLSQEQGEVWAVPH